MTDMKLIVIFHKKVLSSSFTLCVCSVDTKLSGGGRGGRLAIRSIFVIILTGVIICCYGQRSTSIAEQSYTGNDNRNGIAV